MAGEAVIGALRVVIGADSAALDKGLEKAGGDVSSFGSLLKKASTQATGVLASLGAALGIDVTPLTSGFTAAKESMDKASKSGSDLNKFLTAAFVGISAAAAAAGAVLTHALGQAIDRADQLSKASQKFGVPIEQLSALQYAAKLSDVSFEGLGTSLSRLSRNMSDVAGGATNDAANAFKALGISVTNSSGNLKSNTDVLKEMADRFSTMEDGAGKTAIAMQIFGRSGAELIPLLNSGSDGLTQMTDEAKKLGLVFSSETGKAAEQFNDNMTRLGKVWEGFINQLLPALLPALNSLTDTLVEGAKGTESFKSIAMALGDAFQRVVTEAVLAVAQMTALKDGLSALGSSAVQFISLDFSGAVSTLTTGFNGMTAALAAANAQYQKMLDPAVNPFLDPSIMQTIQEAIDFRLTAPIVRSKQETEKATVATDQWGRKLDEASVKKRASDLITGSAQPWEQLRTEMAKAKADLEGFGATNEQVGAVMQKIAEKYNNTWQQVSVGVAGSFQQIAQSFEGESKSMARIAKIAGIAQATISMFVGGAKALELPFPANIAAAAAVLAQGAAIVAQVKSVAGFAEGGMMRVPGPGGRDNQRYMVNLSPGEQVDVWKPGEGGADPRGGGGGEVTIHLHGENYTQKQVRRLIHEINQATRDGSRIAVAGAR